MSDTTFCPAPANWRKLTRHEFSVAMLDMSDAEFQMLVSDMETNGFVGRPILLIGNKSFEVLDGWHQLRASVITEKTPTFERYTGNDPFGEVWRRHGPRKHWNESQRGMVAATVAKRHAGGDHSANLPNAPTQEEAAKTLNVSTRTVTAARKVIEEGTPALQEAVKDGTVSASDAARIVDEPATVQNGAVKKVRKGKAKTVTAAVTTDSDANEAVIKDDEGATVPEKAREAFAKAAAIKALCRKIDGVLHEAKSLAGGPGGRCISVSTIEAQLKDAKGNLWANRATHVCPYCKGKKDKCEACKGEGWVPKHIWTGATGNGRRDQ